MSSLRRPADQNPWINSVWLNGQRLPRRALPCAAPIAACLPHKENEMVKLIFAAIPFVALVVAANATPLSSMTTERAPVLIKRAAARRNVSWFAGEGNL